MALAIMGVIVSLAPPTTPKGRLYWVSAFAAVGLALAVVSLSQLNGNRTEAANDKTAATADKKVLTARIGSLQNQLNELSPVPTSLGELRAFIEKPKPERKADLEIKFAGDKRLKFQFHNRSSETARDPKHWFGIWNYSKPHYDPDVPGVKEPMPLRTRLASGDFIHPGRQMGPWDVLENGGLKHGASDGDQLFGYPFTA
jgi:hypothetical protein